MTEIARSITKNHILNSLPIEDYQRLLPHLKKVDLPYNKSLFLAYEPIEYVYFPDDAMASIVATSADGLSAEIGVIGREGMIGVDVLMGVESTPNDCKILLADRGWRITTTAVREEFERGGAFQKIALRYIHSFMTQISQTAFCNRLHTIEQRLSRWLLMCQDRAKSNRLSLTHDILSIMLGAHRPNVTNKIIFLKEEGMINYRRCEITIIDRKRLQDFTCDCYHVVKNEYDTCQSKNLLSCLVHNKSLQLLRA